MGLTTSMMNVILRLVAVVKRMLCFLHLTRRRKNSGTILPLHTDVKVLSNVGEIQTSLPSNNVELESWDSWGTEERGGDFGRQPATNGNPRHGSRLQGKKSVELEPEPDVDYFQELHLEPSITRPKKIVVRRKEDHNLSFGGISSRLAMSSDIPMTGNELGTLEDIDMNNGWSNEATEDLSSEADMALRDKRRLERDRRVAEHQLKKHEKVVNKVLPKKMAAVKMS